MLTLATREEAGVLILDLDGRMDGGPTSEKVHEFIKQSLNQGKTRFLLNLHGVEWLNSLGLGVMIAAFVSTKRHEGILKLCRPTARVTSVMTTSGVVPEIFEVYDDEQRALESFA